MSKHMTLNEIMKNTADAIREKKGTTDLIAPVDFANEIKGISGGSVGELEGEYFLVKPNGRGIGNLSCLPWL